MRSATDLINFRTGTAVSATDLTISGTESIDSETETMDFGADLIVSPLAIPLDSR